MGMLKKITSILFNSIFIIVTVVSLVFVYTMLQNAGRIPDIMGYRLYVVQSGSMEPDIHTGSLVISKRVSPENLAIGDVVTFKSKDDSTTLVTHRIEQISKENGELSFITKGDANDVIDLEPVKPENIIARVQYDIPYLGYMTDFIKTKQGMLLVVIIPALALLLIEIFKLIGYASELDKQKKAQNHEIKF
ncbi:type I signal peptidase [Acetoanaerobium sticklandii]|uniref:Signal peptidase I n=2 Tax=Acetoanaerobium sticklandii TaxID=1511 RepID=E3PW72_ACESD|nr:type I signal peptidase [Acetoanaerobium sticklandii]